MSNSTIEAFAQANALADILYEYADNHGTDAMLQAGKVIAISKAIMAALEPERGLGVPGIEGAYGAAEALRYCARTASINGEVEAGKVMSLADAIMAVTAQGV